MQIDKQVKHGTYSSYDRDKCRCTICVTAMQARTKIRNSRRSRGQSRLPLEPLLSSLPIEFLKENRRSMNKWRKNGLTVFEADRICTRYKVHPFAVYGTRWYSDMWERIA